VSGSTKTRTAVRTGQVWRSRVGGSRIAIAAVRDDARIVVVYPSGEVGTLNADTLRQLYETSER
jgi:outer membrane protein assembly factor BamB